LQRLGDDDVVDVDTGEDRRAVAAEGEAQEDRLPA
jgi:hypothetical protein